MANASLLRHPVRPFIVLKYVGQLSFVLALLSIVPLVLSLAFEEYQVSWGFIVAIAGLFALGVLGYRLPEVEHLQPNEGLVITALAFLLASLLMAYPMVQGGLKIEDALFEAISGVTTTGLSMVADTDTLPRSILFLRSWMQWYGGLGIVVLSVALLLGRGIIARRLAESEGPLENLITTTQIHARRMVLAYGLLTIVGIVAVWILERDVFSAAVHVLSAVSTGGFSTFNASLEGLGSAWSRAVIMALAFCGALALPLFYYAHRKGAAMLLRDTEIGGLIAGAVLAAVLLFGILWQTTGLEAWDAMGHAVLIGLSAQTTTGFTTLPIPELAQAAKAVLLVPMVVGGSVGSSAGGFKVWRFLIVLALIRFTIRKLSSPPHAFQEMSLGGRLITEEELQRALMLAGLFGAVIFLSWLPFVAAGHDPLDALFDVISATATVGLSTNVAQADLSIGLKYLLCADMLLGRLEFIAFLVLLYPGTWFGKSSPHYP